MKICLYILFIVLMSKDSNYNSLCLQNLLHLQPMWLLLLLSTTICDPIHSNAISRDLLINSSIVLLEVRLTDWFFDTCATHHLAKHHTSLSNVHPYLGTDQVTIGNGHTLPIAHTGKKQFSYSSDQFILQQVLHVPQLSTNLISVSKFCTDNNVFFEFHSDHFLVKDEVSKTIRYQGILKAGLYTFTTPKYSPSAFVMANSTTSTAQEAIWHARLGHPAAPVLSTALPSCNLAFVISCNKLSELCVHCPLAKSH